MSDRWDIGRARRMRFLAAGPIAVAIVALSVGTVRAHDPCPGGGCDHSGGPFTLDLGVSILASDNGTGVLGAPLLLNSNTCCNQGNRVIWAHSPGIAQWGLRYQDSQAKLHFQQTETARFVSVDFGNQRLGVQQPNPVVPLHVGNNPFHTLPVTWGVSALFAGSIGTSIAVKGGAAGGELFVYQDDNNGLIGRVSDHPLGFRTKNENRIWVTNEGLVGIGTVFPTATLHVLGDLLVSGSKSFVQPHPTDPTREIVYVALEGGEAATFVRGTARLVDGHAMVTLPEDFGLVTEEDGLTVQVTPRGQWLELFVAQLDPGTLVVREARGKGGAFDYWVNGVRKGHANHVAVRPTAPTGMAAR